MKALTRTKKHVSRRFRRFPRANEAVSALEYAILAGVVAVGTGAAVATFNETVQDAITKLGKQVTNSGGLADPENSS